MGTRSTLRIKASSDSKTNLAIIYRQMDGYFTGMGKDIKDKFGNHRLLNGISLNDDISNSANGMDCLAAQVVAYLKNDAGLGHIYLVDEYYSEEYDYILYEDEGIICFQAYNHEKLWYDGPLKDFDPEMTEDDIRINERMKKIDMLVEGK